MYGFRKGERVENATSALIHLAQIGNEWGSELSSSWAICDIEKAFDNLSLDLVVNTLDKLGIAPWLILALYETLHTARAVVCFQGVAAKHSTPINNCVKQGGCESPLLFNLSLYVVLRGLVESWKTKGYGINIRGVPEYTTDSYRTTHFCWADNIIVLGENRTQLKLMMTEFTHVLRQAGFKWKHSSLEYLQFGFDPDVPNNYEDITIDTADDSYVFPYKPHGTHILGVAVPSSCRMGEIINHRCAIARKTFWADRSFYTAKCISVFEKYRQYCARIQSQFLHGMAGLAMTKGISDTITTFEHMCIEAMTPRTPRGDLTYESWKRTCIDRAVRRFRDLGFISLVERYSKLQYAVGSKIASFLIGEFQHSSHTHRQTCACMLHAHRVWREEREKARIEAIGTVRYDLVKRRRIGAVPETWYDLFFSWDQKWYERNFHSKSCYDSFYKHCLNVGRFTTTQSERIAIQPRRAENRKNVVDNEVLSKRMATICMREIVWNTRAGEIQLDIMGDSEVVCRWLRGEWQCYNNLYANRVYRIINILAELTSCFNISSPVKGGHLIRHEYREANGRADELTHKARAGINFICYSFTPPPCPPDLSLYGNYTISTNTIIPVVALRGAFDGGVSSEGVGSGWWLQSTSSLGAHPDWHDCGFGCFPLRSHCTVCDAELSAVESLVDAISRVLWSWAYARP